MDENQQPHHVCAGQDVPRTVSVAVRVPSRATSTNGFPTSSRPGSHLRTTPAPDRCSPLLPVQRSVDRFTYIDLIALTRSKRPLTLPLYRIFQVEELRQVGQPIREALAAEMPLLEEWAAPEELRNAQPGPEEVRLPIGRLLGERSVRVDDGAEPVPLSAASIGQLLLTGRTGVRTGDGEGARDVIVVAEEQAMPFRASSVSVGSSGSSMPADSSSPKPRPSVTIPI